MELALGTDGRDALRSGGTAVGGPVTDPHTGAVLGCSAPPCAPGAKRRDSPCRSPAGSGDRGGRPAGGAAAAQRDERAGVRAGSEPGRCAAAHRDVPRDGRRPGGRAEPVDRPAVTAEFAAFEAGTVPVVGLVGEPGTGRTTELAALAARRAVGPVPALTLWLRGADLLAEDASVADALTRTLQRSGRIVTAAGAGAA
ncbi:hypothetical protein NKH18_37165 [Streptomyces sp. M10(2022)]